MPVEMKCQHCGFEGCHGFTDTVGGITVFYHTDAHQMFQTPDGEWFKTRKEAWTHDRVRHVARGASENWLKGWDAVMCDTPDQKKHDRYMKKWRDEDKRRDAAEYEMRKRDRK
jgi:hypothetical protein